MPVINIMDFISHYFIEAFDGSGTQKTKELLQAEVRAHAARVAHQQRKRRQSLKSPQDTGTQPRAIRARDDGTDEHKQLERSSLSKWRTGSAPAPRTRQHMGALVRRHTDGSDLWCQKQFATPATIRIYWELAVPSASVVYKIFDVRPVHTEEWLQYMAADVFFDAGSAAMQAIQDTATDPSNALRPSSAVLDHKSKALTHLRRELNGVSTVSNILLMDMLFLAIVDKRFGNMHEFDIHRSNLGKAVETRGGLAALDDYMKSSLLSFEFFWAWSTGTSIFPMLPKPELIYPPFPIPPVLAKVIDVLPRGFRKLAMQRKLSLHTIRVLDRIIYAQEGRMGTQTSRDATYDDFGSAMPAWNVIDEGEPFLEKLLGLTLLLYTTTTLTPFRAVILSQFVWTRSELTPRLLRCKRIRDRDEEDCLFWIWTVVVASWKDSTGDLLPQGRELLAAQQMRFPEVWSTGTAMSILESFFCSEDFVQVVDCCD